MSKPLPSITLIGAGLVGSLLAVYLSQRGYTVRVFEKRPDMRKASISAGRSINLALANRGIRPLEAIGLMDVIRPIIIPMLGRELHDEQGNLSFLPYGQRPHEVVYSVSRGELNKTLMTAAEQRGNVTIEFSQAVEHIDYQRKTLTLRDEQSGQTRTDSFDILIGADGGGSAVRRTLDQHLNKMSREEKLPHSYKELHIADNGKGGFRMKREALHIWPRDEYMLIALPNPDGSFTVTLFMPDEGEHSFSRYQDKPTVQQFFREKFPDALTLMPDAADQYLQNPTGFLGTVYCDHWHLDDHTLLIGDAAHAIVPFHGQGMNCGFEDCFDLNALLDQYQDDWSQVMPAFQRLRKPNGDAIAQMALENYIEMRHSVNDPKFQLKKQVAFALENRIPNTFIPRYSMVMFHHIPYVEALRRGVVQADVLDELCQSATRLDEVKLDQGVEWAKARLSPITIE